ncbi:flippase [Enterobacter sp.]|uniref:flippase n=1 Tax=Enterobacter sp. TaxID=42895 RepID=UPI00296FFB4C|nr:flippase [Enterobacter sp.]
MVFKNIVWQLLEKVIRLSVTVIVSALLARYLGPDGFGQYNFINALISIALVVTSLGFNRILVRDSTSCKNENEHITLVTTAFYLRVIAAISAFIVISLFFIFSDAANGYIYAISLASIIFVSFDVIDYHLQGQSIFKVATSCRIISFLTASALRAWLVYINADISYFYATILVEYAVAGILILIVTRSKYNKIVRIDSSKFSLEKAKILLKESWPEIIAGFGAILFMKMDQIMLQYMQGPASVGIYSAATRISEAWYFLPTAIVAATFPVFMRKHNKNSADQSVLLKDVGHIISILVWLSIFAAIAVNIVGSALINLVFGIQYIESAIILKLHIWAGIFLCMGIASGSWLVAQKKLKLNLYRNMAGLIVNFILNIFLIPRYGASGAAIATIAGLAMAFLIFDLFNKELRKMFFIKLLAFSPIQFYKSIKFFLEMK